MNDTGRYGRAMRRLRKERGISQEALALSAGIERSYLSRIENGHVEMPQIETRERIANGIGVSESDVLREAGLTDAGGRILRIGGGGALREEPGEHDDSIDPDEYRVRAILRALPAEDRAMLVDIADVFDRRHRERFD